MILFLNFVQLFFEYWTTLETQIHCLLSLHTCTPYYSFTYRRDMSPYIITLLNNLTSAAYLSLWLYSVIKDIPVHKKFNSLNKHSYQVIYDVDLLKQLHLLRTAQMYFTLQVLLFKLLNLMKNLSWLPHIVKTKQQLAIVSVCNFFK